MSGVQLELSTMKREWLDDAMGQFALIASRYRRFTTDDLHPILGEPASRGWWGALTAKLQAEGFIREAGRVASQRKSANGRKITIWEVVK